MYGLVRFAGFVALLVTPAALLASALFALSSTRPGIVTLHAGVALTGAIAVSLEREHVLDRVGSSPAVFEPAFERAAAIDAVAVVAGAVLAYVLSVAAEFGPVVGAALVGLVAGLALSDVAVPVYCGSFVGMATPTVFPSLEYVAAAGLITGLAFVATTGTFGGFGGKLGTLALFGCATTVALTGASYAGGGTPQWNLVPAVVPVATAGAVATVVLSVRFALGAVVGSAVVGVVAGVAFPALLPAGSTLATVAFCASFVGMSTTDRLESETQVALAGALSGLVFVAVAPAFVGAGGKLGTVAFVSCLALFGATRGLEGLRARTP